MARRDRRGRRGRAAARRHAGRFEVVRGDLLHLPFPDASVDRVMASEVLEHIPDDVTAMAEIFRVLKPGGRMVITVPRYGPERICWALSDEYHANEGGHIRIYRGGVLRDRLASVGLVPGRTHHAHSLHAPFWWLKCAVGVEKDNAAVRGLPPAAGVGPHAPALADPDRREADGPGVRQEPRHLRRQARDGGRLRARRGGAGPCRGLSAGRLLPELPGVLTGDQVRATVAWIAAAAGRRRRPPLVPRRAARPVGLRRGRDGPGPRRRARPRRAPPTAGWPAGSGPTGPGPRSTATAPRSSPDVESNHAGYLAVGLWHHWLITGDERFVARAVAGRPPRPGPGRRHAAGRRRDRLGAAPGPDAGRAGAAHREREPLPGAALRHRPGRAGRRAAAGLGAGGQPTSGRRCAPAPTPSPTGPATRWTGTTRSWPAR